jgi:hypothetical protein
MSPPSPASRIILHIGTLSNDAGLVQSSRAELSLFSLAVIGLDPCFVSDKPLRFAFKVSEQRRRMTNYFVRNDKERSISS